MQLQGAFGVVSSVTGSDIDLSMRVLYPQVDVVKLRKIAAVRGLVNEQVNRIFLNSCATNRPELSFVVFRKQQFDVNSSVPQLLCFPLPYGERSQAG